MLATSDAHFFIAYRFPRSRDRTIIQNSLFRRNGCIEYSFIALLFWLNRSSSDFQTMPEQFWYASGIIRYMLGFFLSILSVFCPQPQPQFFLSLNCTSSSSFNHSSLVTVFPHVPSHIHPFFHKQLHPPSVCVVSFKPHIVGILCCLPVLMAGDAIGCWGKSGLGG